MAVACGQTTAGASRKDMCKCLSCISEIAPDTSISPDQYFLYFLISLTSSSCFLLPSTHPCIHLYTDSLFYFSEATLLYPVVAAAWYSFTLHLVEERRQRYFFTLWLWVKYDFNYHENVLYYQWEDKNRLRKLWDALTDDNGQVSMQAAVLEKMIDFHRLTKALRKGGGSTCKADSTDPVMFKMRLFALIRWTFLVLIERSTLPTN